MPTDKRAPISDEELRNWAQLRADDAGHLARELIGYRSAALKNMTVDDLVKKMNEAGEVWDDISQLECLSTEQETQFEELAKTLIGVKIVDTN